MAKKEKRKSPLRGPVRQKSNNMTIKYNDIVAFEPLTANQEKACDAWDEGDNLVLTGTAGTGKTFLAMSLAMEAALDEDTPQDKVVIIRSIVATRDPGHLPGTKQEKEEAFTSPYKALCTQIFEDTGAYGKLISSNKLEFESTSFIRGLTWDNAVIVVDEMQNLNFHELDTVITRVGRDCRIIFSGDYKQTDFRHEDEKSGIMKFLNILEQMKDFTIVTYGWEDIVRSDFVRDYIMTKEMLGY
jgi:predicted ribonuclease YlaK